MEDNDIKGFRRRKKGTHGGSKATYAIRLIVRFTADNVTRWLQGQKIIRPM